MKYSNYIGLSFAAAADHTGERLDKTRSDCFNYGIMFGCNDGCPALWLGECAEPTENIENLDFDNEQIEELKEIYKI